MSTDLNLENTPFARCPDCGGVYVAGASHTCGGSKGTNTREEREALVDADERDGRETVMFLRGRSDSAYHEAEFVFDLDAMLAVPRAACGSSTHHREYAPTTRANAQRRGRFPCAHCRPTLREKAFGP